MKLHGIHVPHRKNTADSAPVRLAPPKTVAIPMSMHIGKPAKVIVKRGDEVKVGTKFQLTVTTTAGVEKIGLFNEKGTGIAKTVVDKAIDADGNITWTLSLNISTVGAARKVDVKVLGATGEWIDGGSFTIKVTRK